MREFQRDDRASESAGQRASWSAGASAASFSVPLVFQDEVIGALTLVEKRAVSRLHRERPAAAGAHGGAGGRRRAQRAHVPPRGGAEPALSARCSAPAAAMTSTIDLDELLATIARGARQALDTAECAIDTYDAATETLTVVAPSSSGSASPTGSAGWAGVYSLGEYRVRPADAATGAHRRGARLGPGPGRANRAEHARRTARRPTSTCRSSTRGGRSGCWSSSRPTSERHFTDEERQLAAALGEQAAAAIHHAQLLLRSTEPEPAARTCCSSRRAPSARASTWTRCSTPWRAPRPSCSAAEECQIQEYDRGRQHGDAGRALAARHDGASRAGQPRTRCSRSTTSPTSAPSSRPRRSLEQLRSDPSLAQTTRDVFDKYGDRAYLNVPLVFNEQPVGVLVLVEKSAGTALDRRRGGAGAPASPSRRPSPSSTPVSTSASRTRRSPTASPASTTTATSTSGSSTRSHGRDGTARPCRCS